MNLYCLQHEPHEGPGAIVDWAESRRHRLTVIRPYLREPAPFLAPREGLLVMGGSMNVDQEAEYPWLADEKKCIAVAIDDGNPVLGICLGAQLIARALGAKVTRNRHPEIGWFPIEKTAQAGPLFDPLPSPLEVLHWHGDTFDLPEGATHVAFSEACQNQAFLYREKVVGLQFHLEVTRHQTAQMIKAGGDIPPGPFVQSPDVILAQPDRFDRMHTLLYKWLDRFFKN